ncbi:MAG: hypothetical protein KF795_01000 [Labilithrix sp.]|nr:hypothetical protein [Labilithrix sp.]
MKLGHHESVVAIAGRPPEAPDVADRTAAIAVHEEDALSLVACAVARRAHLRFV